MKLYRRTDDFLEIRIEQGRLMVVAVGVVLLAALVFLTGVLVGKTLWGGVRYAPPPPIAGQPLPDPVPTPPSEPGAKKDYGFYDDVRRPASAEASHDPLRAAPPPAEEPSEPAASVRTGPVAEGVAPPPVETPAEAPAEAPVQPEAAAPAKAALPAPLFTIQVGSFKDRAAARALQESLAGRGVKSEIVRVGLDDKDWYRIHVGRFAQRAEADKYYRSKLLPLGIKGFVLAR